MFLLSLLQNFKTAIFFFFLLSFLSYGIIVSKDGTGNYTTVGEAIANAPNFSAEPYVIHVKAGIYEETFSVTSNKKNVMIMGDGRNTTKITGNLPGQSTVDIVGASFLAQDIAFENSAGIDAGPSQAVRTESNNSIYYRCSFEGFQDTLFAVSGRQFYKNCDIYGTVDFIYGDAAAVFQDCMVYARNRETVVFTAQSKDNAEEKTGFTFQRCNFTMAPEDANWKSNVHAFLGRPWNICSTVVIMESYIDSMVDPSGWQMYHNESTNCVTYWEFTNTGPGSNTSLRVKWPGVRTVNDSKEIEPYTAQVLLGGDSWIPQRGMPYDGGL